MTMTDISVPSASEYVKKVALAEADEAAKEAKAQRQAEDDRKALLSKLTEPSRVSDEEAIKRAIKMIEGATSSRLTEVKVSRFPNSLCTDRGRKIIQLERGWEETLTGVPKEIYLLWEKYFKDKGYGLRAEIADYPNGMPGDVVMTLTWHPK